MSVEQTEFICPTCRRKTVVTARTDESENVLCPRCEIEMKPHVATSRVAAAAANSPTSSGTTLETPVKTRKATTPRATKAKAPKATKTTRVSAKAKAAAEAAPTVPDFGEFRCGCCGHVKHVALGTEKPTGGWRCPTCYVRLDWIRA